MEGVSLLMGYTSTTNGKDEDDYVVDNLMIDVEDKTGDRVRSQVSSQMYPTTGQRVILPLHQS
jgi:hypothetical protein